MRITLDQLVQHLSDSGLMSAEEAAKLCERLSATDGAAESESIVGELSASGKVTAFQAERVCAGHVGGLVFGEYVVLDRIGAGGMGEVFKGRHRTMDRIVAIKVLPDKKLDSPGAVERFKREVRAAARLHHPNIVTAYDAGHKGDLHYLVLEYVEGRSLFDVVNDRGPLPVDQAMDFVLQAARGLEYAHGQGVFHRDIKPANLLLDKEGMIKILDMGLARVEDGTGAAEPSDGLTTSRQIMGTSDYIPPEQAKDTRKADARSDIYSLGCTLYRLLTGRTPYYGETVMDKIFAHVGDPIPSLRAACPAAPEPLDALYQRMMAKKPVERPQTMTEVIAALEDIIRGPAARSSVDSGVRGVDRAEKSAGSHDHMSHASVRGKSRASGTVPRSGTGETVAPAMDDAEPVSEETIDLSDKGASNRNTLVQRRPGRRQWMLIGISGGLLLIGAALVVIYVQSNRDTNIVTRGDEVRVREERTLAEIPQRSPPPRLAIALVKAGEARQYQERLGPSTLACRSNKISICRAARS